MVESLQKAKEKADKEYKKAKKALETGIFKFKFSPDYYEGRKGFEAAAKLYMEAKDEQKAIECYLSAADCAEQKTELLLAAENYTKAAHLTNDTEQTMQFLEKAN